MAPTTKIFRQKLDGFLIITSQWALQRTMPYNSVTISQTEHALYQRQTQAI